MKIRLLIILALLSLTACGGGGVSQTTNPDTSATLSVSKLSSGSATVSIPIDVFGGSESDLTDATIDVLLNDSSYSNDLEAEDYYSSSSGAVVFTLIELEDADSIEIRITLASGSRIVFMFTASSTQDQEVSAEDTTGNEEGYASLEDRDIATAQTEYCDAISAGSTDSATAFGCFLSDLLALPQSTHADTLLTSLGQSTLDTKTDILEGVFDDLASSSSTPGFDDFDYLEYSQLPLTSIIDPNRSLYLNGYNFAGILVELATTGTTAEDLQDEIVALRDEFEDMEDMLDIVLDDSDFSYTIPQELFNTTADVVVSYNDARLFMSGTQTLIVLLNIIDAYDFGVTFDDILDGDDIDLEILAEDLNGTGATIGSVTVDSIPFLTMDDESLITGSETTFTQAMEYLSDGMQALSQGEVSEILGNTFDYGDAYDHFELVQGIADDLLRSINTNSLVELSVVSDYSSRTVRINMKEFFTNPPSAADVSGSDPFVYQVWGDLEPVESYFETLLEDIVEF